MLTVDHYGQIRRAHRDGMSIREIARTFHRSRDKIREILQNPLPRPYTRTKPAPAPILGPYQAAIDALLAADEEAPPKQRHTAMQVYRRLRAEHHYQGSYDPVRRYVARHRRDRRETFIPLAHDPGQRLEADFGHIHVDFPDGRRLVPVLITAWSYSDYGFAMAMPSERTEAILAGLVEAFTFFGCVPHEVWWDNPTTVVAKIFPGRERRPNGYYAALASHYTFEPLFCMPARGNEKPYVETRVRVLQRQWATPVPQVADLAALNRHLRGCCLAEGDRTIAVAAELSQQPVQAERIIATVGRLAQAAAGPPASVAAVTWRCHSEAVTSPCHSEVVTPMCHSTEAPLCQYQVPRPDLGRFDQLLGQGGSQDECQRQHPPVAEEQPQATAAAGDARRVR